LNNNRGNNRRRGRNNRSQGGNHQQLNRVDSRARGNAPQMLDKYRKLAEEAHRNGDRVQAEYYLQFADHYFRVIADGKARMEEQRPRRGDERGDRDSDNSGNQDSDDDSRDEDSRDDDNGDNDQNDDRREESRKEPPKRRRRAESAEENPFTRSDKPARRPRAPRSADDSRNETENSVGNDGGLDPQALPPAIGDTEEKPKRARRTRKPKVEDTSNEDDVKQAVNG